MTTATEFFSEFIDVHIIPSGTERALYLSSFLHKNTSDIDPFEPAQVSYDM